MRVTWGAFVGGRGETGVVIPAEFMRLGCLTALLRKLKITRLTADDDGRPGGLRRAASCFGRLCPSGYD